MAIQPKISILLPHFQTPELTLLCLRLLRQRTCRRDYEVIVIDNGSTDGSGERIGRLPWVRLLRREAPAGERPALSHGRALNLGARAADAEFLLAMHTDTMVLRPDWLDFLLRTIEAAGARCGMVGSWKLEEQGAWRRAWKWVEDGCRAIRGRRWRGKRYIRSHCAIYRRKAIDVCGRMFDPSCERFAAGEELHLAMDLAGFTSHFVSPKVLGRYVSHLNHATMALNHDFGRGDPYFHRTRAKAIKRIRRFVAAVEAEGLLADAAIDAS